MPSGGAATIAITALAAAIHPLPDICMQSENDDLQFGDRLIASCAHLRQLPT